MITVWPIQFERHFIHMRLVFAFLKAKKLNVKGISQFMAYYLSILVPHLASLHGKFYYHRANLRTLKRNQADPCL